MYKHYKKKLELGLDSHLSLIEVGFMNYDELAKGLDKRSGWSERADDYHHLKNRWSSAKCEKRATGCVNRGNEDPILDAVIVPRSLK